MLFKHQRRKDNFKLSPYHRTSLEFFKGHCYLDESESDFEITKGFLLNKISTGGRCKIAKIEETPVDVLEHFGLALKKGDLLCANPECDKPINKGKYCSRDCYHQSMKKAS